MRAPHLVSPMLFIWWSASLGPVFKIFLMVRPMVDMLEEEQALTREREVVVLP